MGGSKYFEARLVPKRSRNFPKKILNHKKIPINETYAFTLSIWIADTPESNRKPTVNLVLSHSSQSFRLCFNSVFEMNEAVTELHNFVLDKSQVVNKAIIEANREFFEYHEKKGIQDLNNNTVSTVIQDISNSDFEKKRTFVNKKTGEIFEG